MAYFGGTMPFVVLLYGCLNSLLYLTGSLYAKVKVFIWLVLNNAIRTWKNLYNRDQYIDEGCGIHGA